MLIIGLHSTFFKASPVLCCAALGPTFPPDQSCNHSRITLAIGAIKCHPREKGTTGRSERQHPTHGDNAYNLSPTCQPFLGDGGQFLLIRNNWIQTNIDVFDERQIRVTFHNLGNPTRRELISVPMDWNSAGDQRRPLCWASLGLGGWVASCLGGGGKVQAPTWDAYVKLFMRQPKWGLSIANFSNRNSRNLY